MGCPSSLRVRQPLQNQRFKVARLVGPKLLIGVGQERDKTLGVFFHQRLVADEPEPLAMSALGCEPKPSEIVDVKFLLRELQSALDSSAEAFVFVSFAHRCAPVRAPVAPLTERIPAVSGGRWATLTIARKSLLGGCFPHG